MEGDILCLSIHAICLVSQLCPILCDPWTVVHQAPLSMGFSRQEYWEWLPFPSPMSFYTVWLFKKFLYM